MQKHNDVCEDLNNKNSLINCIFITVFHQEKYVEMFLLLLESILLYGNLDCNTEILIYTSTQFMQLIKQNNLFNSKIVFEINDTYNNIDKSCKARLDLFHLSSTEKYNKILYLDTYIIVKGDINQLFNLCKEDILYVLEEGEIDNCADFYGKTLFGDEIRNYTDKTAFTSGILLFNNCEKIKDLFTIIQNDMINRPYNFSCFDQPYIVYNAFKYNLYNNKILKEFVVNNDNNIHSNKVIHHFPGYPGVYQHKIKKMTFFLNNINKQYFSNGIKIYDTHHPPSKNTSLSLVGLCVSYNYFDTLQFMLPINYLHFECIYLITQPDDIETIEFCKQFINVKVLFYNFKNNNKSFDKYGALNCGQREMYKDYPDSWYLIIDSDIILPNNMIDILINENLNVNCIYGGLRYNVLKSSELLKKKQSIKHNDNYIYNNILWNKKTPPSILGCFQLYKKHVFHYENYKNAGAGDYDFGYKNFNLFCHIQKLVYFHLGKGGINWNGKVVSFIDDINISLEKIYYNCYTNRITEYYNLKKQLVHISNNNNVDIFNDVWTCSYKMRQDIADFFARKTHFKIAEIGSHKGYTTKVLSNIFSKVYAVDNNVEWTNFNRVFNKETTNIEYVMLDIYNNSWNILPDDIEVSFIDADHSYTGCRSDLLNSINRFKNLQYIILDDYGVWSGVKQIVDELIKNNILIFEKFIGITDVPGPNGIVENVNEGIICKVNTVFLKENANIINQYRKPIINNKNKGTRIKMHFI